MRSQQIVLFDQLLLSGPLVFGVFDDESLNVFILRKDSAIELYFSEFIEGLAMGDFLLELIIFGHIILPPSKDVVILDVLEEIAFGYFLLSQLAEANPVEDLHEYVHIIWSHILTSNVIDNWPFVL